MRALTVLTILCLLESCGAGGADTASPARADGDAVARLLGPHRHVLAGADKAYVCRVRGDPMARAHVRSPAALDRFVRHQEIEARSAELDASRLRALCRSLVDPASYSIPAHSSAVSEPCRWVVVLQKGEDARILGLNLEEGLVRVSAGTAAQEEVQLALSEAGVQLLRPLTEMPLADVR